MKYFIDTHDVANGTFPEGLRTTEKFVEGFSALDEISEEEGVTALRAHVSIEEGKAFCFIKLSDPEAVRLAHENAGFPIDSITEIKTITASDLRRTAGGPFNR